MGDLGPPVPHVEEPPPVGQRGEERAGVFAQALVVSVVEQPGGAQEDARRQPVLQDQVQDLVYNSLLHFFWGVERGGCVYVLVEEDGAEVGVVEEEEEEESTPGRRQGGTVGGVRRLSSLRKSPNV